MKWSGVGKSTAMDTRVGWDDNYEGGRSRCNTGKLTAHEDGFAGLGICPRFACVCAALFRYPAFWTMDTLTLIDQIALL